ncbi:response regulator transcription factor [uncultured Acetatifactor sp.]|uniref:response regulator transcription factor n=1 Tax=uncultured Acetatifactor sp. TaxID=1671927 RepID=UPI002620C9AC|nr:response regulator transcription factor [uncultured Acetatifactor sp.]
MHILIIEDDPLFRREMKDFLENSLYHVTALTEFDRIVPKALSLRPDLILLDWNLPGQSGFELCAEIRACSDVPIIFVTGREDSMDEAAALLKGGDDYITKPFHPSVLLAHISAVLKRTRKEAQDSAVLIHLGLELDLAKAQVRYQGRRAELTRNELKILHCLFRHPGEIVPRTELIEYLWDASVFIDDNSLSIHVTRIRGKLKELGLPDFIHTKRGMGYFI